jgi:hypothetical protein
MVMSKTTRMEIMRRINDYLSDGSIEELFEQIDLEPDEAIFALYENGLIDDELFEKVLPL